MCLNAMSPSSHLPHQAGVLGPHAQALGGCAARQPACRHLQLALPGLRALLEDVQNERRAVAHARLAARQRLGQVLQLPRGQLAIEYDCACAAAGCSPGGGEDERLEKGRVELIGFCAVHHAADMTQEGDCRSHGLASSPHTAVAPPICRSPGRSAHPACPDAAAGSQPPAGK